MYVFMHACFHIKCSVFDFVEKKNINTFKFSFFKYFKKYLFFFLRPDEKDTSKRVNHLFGFDPRRF